MANFDFDQAEGLRRMLAGPKPRIVTFLSATRSEDKGALMMNLGASLVSTGNDVLIVDASPSARGIAARLGVAHGMSLQNAARQECALDQVAKPMRQGFSLAALAREPLRSARHSPDESRRMVKAFDFLVKQSGIVLVDAELDADDELPLPALAAGEIVVQVSSNAASIKSAYCVIKRLNAKLGRRPFSILVTGASENESKVVYDNMVEAARRYLAIELKFMGSVPADEHLNRAARLGRSVVDAFPLAGASVAFRRMAGRFSMQTAPAGMRSSQAGRPQLETEGTY